MAKTWDQVRNAQVINMRRNNARIAISSLRYYRKSGELSSLDMISVKFRAQELITIYRQSNKVLCRNI